MNSTEYTAALEAAYARNLEISKRKCNDYAGESGKDAFANFRAIEVLTGGKVSVEMGIITRMSDKLVRATNLLSQEAAVKDESIGDTLADLANYAMILRIYIGQKPTPGTYAGTGAQTVTYRPYQQVAVSPLLEQIESLRNKPTSTNESNKL